MKKKTSPETSDPADHEVDFRGGVRGKYAERFRDAGVTVRIEPDVARVYPDAAAVNEALRRLIRETRDRN